MDDEMYVVTTPTGGVYKCLKNYTLQKTGGVCPIYGDVIDADMNARWAQRNINQLQAAANAATARLAAAQAATQR